MYFSVEVGLMILSELTKKNVKSRMEANAK